jgi:hypothetical protein
MEEIMMNADDGAKEYTVRALANLGGIPPVRYVEMLRKTPIDRAIEGLRPWYFDHDPESAVQFCSEVVGRPVLPFAQAVEQDMMACFINERSENPAVIVINPWSEDKAAVIRAKLPDYDAWLNYATEISRQVQADEAAEED